MNDRRKIMVLGFDGASYNILRPLMRKGRLPNFARMIEQGISGELRSTMPPVSGPAWTTFATGVNPGKHGVFDFFRNDFQTYDSTPINSTFLPIKTLWEILSKQGMRVGVTNMLFTYPTTEVNGFLISGRGTPGEDTNYAYPKELKQEILAFEPDYRIEPYRNISHTRRFLKLLSSQLECQERVNRYLLKKYPCDFSVSYFGVPDLLQHIFWRHMDPDHPHHHPRIASRFRPYLEECYATIDRFLGERLNLLGGDSILMVVSDHGSCPLHKLVHLNLWLQQQGLLSLKAEHGKSRLNLASGMSNVAGKVINVISMFDVLGLRRAIGFKTREARRALTRRTFVDWARTKAYTGRPSECGLYVNVRGREGQGIVEPGTDYESVRDFIIEGLEALRDPENGQRIFHRVMRREEVFPGPHANGAPDIVLDFGGTPYQATDSVLKRELFEKVPSLGVTGTHSDNGILIVSGAGIKRNAEIEGAAICDLAPTILFLLGRKIPSYMDGKVLGDLLVAPPSPGEIQRAWEEGEGSERDTRRKEQIFTEAEAESISNKLKELGYL